MVHDFVKYFVGATTNCSARAS